MNQHDRGDDDDGAQVREHRSDARRHGADRDVAAPATAAAQPREGTDRRDGAGNGQRQSVGVVPQRLQWPAALRVTERQGEVGQRRFDEEHRDRRDQHGHDEHAVPNGRAVASGDELHDGVQQDVEGRHKRYAAQQFCRGGPAAGHRAALFPGQQAVLHRREEQPQECVHQRDAGEGLVRHLTAVRWTVTAATVGTIEHQIDDHESETSQQTSQLGIVAGDDGYVEAGPHLTGSGDQLTGIREILVRPPMRQRRFCRRACTLYPTASVKARGPPRCVSITQQ
ncbi:hypothetical protein [Mycolicibacter arupensis]|uniref:hypothetical protein n=1 Tax=Mycolicibacter arupensis TaxID=342002 RepID=UPI0023F49AF6|nr:hypothetical protein [Mycolicibacter arupensis]